MRKILLSTVWVLGVMSLTTLWVGDKTTAQANDFTPIVSSTDNPSATGFNNSPKLVYDASRALLHAVYSKEDGIWYQNSSDGGATWDNEEKIGHGSYPTLTMDSSNELHCAWVSLIPVLTPPDPSDGQAQPFIVPWEQYTWELRYCQTQGGQWQADCQYVLDSFSKTPQIIEDVHFSSPAISTTDDSVHVLMERTTFGGLYSWFWVLSGYSFQKNNPDFIGFSFIDFAYEEAPPIPPPSPAPQSLPLISDPSCVADRHGNLHIAYVTESEIRYVQKTGDNFSEIEVISPEGEYYQPSIGINKDEITVVFSGNPIPGAPGQILCRRKFLGSNWGQVERIDTGDNISIYPVCVQNQLLWSEQVAEDNYEIFYSRLSGYEWTVPVNLSNTPENSILPTAATTGVPSWLLYTEGDEPPYMVIAGEIFPEMTVQYAVNLGSEEPASGTIQREGFIAYGNERYQQVDYHRTELRYVIPGLDPGRHYAIEFDWYHESNENWKQLFRIDNVFTEHKWVSSHERMRVRKPIPQSCVMDGKIEITNTLTSDNGLAVLSGFAIYEVE